MIIFFVLYSTSGGEIWDGLRLPCIFSGNIKSSHSLSLYCLIFSLTALPHIYTNKHIKGIIPVICDNCLGVPRCLQFVDDAISTISTRVRFSMARVVFMLYIV